ncbi:hypothetical protein [Nostoc sp.]|uniref:hypothetical protein n=1 Tax=Nostoc sp. TaxID=1180 RepID=UPI002FF4A81E
MATIVHYYAYEAGKRCNKQAKLACEAFEGIGVRASDFSRHVEKTILRVFQALIFPLTIFINLKLLRIRRSHHRIDWPQVSHCNRQSVPHGTRFNRVARR